ncbi:MAG: thioredoxin family protein [Phycisphaerales bacterium]|jgi:thiol:disulfide interchange protein
MRQDVSTFPRLRLILLGVLALLGVAAAPVLAQAPDDEVVHITAVPDRAEVRPGDQVAIAVVMSFAEGWHSHTNAPKIPKSWEDFFAIPTTIDLVDSVGIKFGPVQWPAAEVLKLDLAATGTPVDYGVFAGKAIAYVPASIDPAASGQATVTIKVRYQACNDKTCLLAKTVTVPVTLKIVPAGTPSATIADPDLFKGFDTASFAAVGQAPKADTGFETEVFGYKIAFDAGSAAGLALLLGLSVVGGFVLNLTPCVLPVIPLKVMGLSHSAGNPRRALFLGIVMSVGVIAFWLSIGVAISTLSWFKAVNQLFQQPWFTIGVGVFIALMATGMLGLFDINLPGFVYLIDPKTESPAGSFVFGIMTAVLSTPCTAPFMGAAAAWSTKQPIIVTLATFGAIGFGMAIPYLVLAAFPKLVSRVPKSGPGSALVKQVMGLFMLGVAVFFLGSGLDPLLRLPVDPPMRWHWWVVALLVVAASAWMIGRSLKIMKPGPLLVFLVVAGLGVSAGGVAFAVQQTDRGPIKWVGYTQERFDQARAEKKVIVLDFTAEWCLNCKALEGTVLNRKDVADALNAPGVVAFRVDLTGENKPGQAKLQELKWAGIPLLAIFGPGTPEPVKFDSYTPQLVTSALAKAAGGR